jgi:hypothetical protein
MGSGTPDDNAPDYVPQLPDGFRYILMGLRVRILGDTAPMPLDEVFPRNKQWSCNSMETVAYTAL